MDFHQDWMTMRRKMAHMTPLDPAVREEIIAVLLPHPQTREAAVLTDAELVVLAECVRCAMAAPVGGIMIAFLVGKTSERMVLDDHEPHLDA